MDLPHVRCPKVLIVKTDGKRQNNDSNVFNGRSIEIDGKGGIRRLQGVVNPIGLSRSPSRQSAKRLADLTLEITVLQGVIFRILPPIKGTDTVYLIRAGLKVNCVVYVHH